MLTRQSAKIQTIESFCSLVSSILKPPIDAFICQFVGRLFRAASCVDELVFDDVAYDLARDVDRISWIAVRPCLELGGQLRKDGIRKRLDIDMTVFSQQV